MVKLSIVLLLIIANTIGLVHVTTVKISDEEAKFYTNFIGVVTNRPIGKEYLAVIHNLLSNETFRLEDIKYTKSPRRCLSCRFLFHTLIKMSRQKTIPKATIEAVGRSLCRLGGTPIHVCNGIARIYVHSFVYIVQQRPQLTADDFCRQLLADVGCSDHQRSDPKRPQITIKPHQKSLYIASGSRSKPLKILHIGDIHMDQAYVVGGENHCDSVACCRYIDPYRIRANKWGDYGYCDQPAHAFQNSLEQMAKRHPDVDLVYLTGNILHHHSWDLSKEEVKRDIHKAASVIRGRFAFKDVPVIVALGNHDTHALGLFSPYENKVDSHQYLYDHFKTEVTSHFYKKKGMEFPDQHEGYYSVSPFEGLRVIVLNNNVANIYNWWLLLPAAENLYTRQLQWLYDTLESAERNSERVHILAHIPAGSYLLIKDYTSQYRKIVERFTDIIAAQFNGNTGLDEFTLMFGKPIPPKPISIAWNAGSLTANGDVNPSYRLYSVNPGTFAVEDHETFTYDLEQANANFVNAPVWNLEYTMKKRYNLPNLSLSSMERLLERFAVNRTLLLEYTALKVRSDVDSISETCKDDCLNEVLCTAVRSEVGDDFACLKFLMQWQISLVSKKRVGAV